MDTSKKSRARWARTPLACVLALGTGAVLAQANPFYVGASQLLERESNFFRTADGEPTSSETVSSTSLLTGLDQPIGRQRLFADLALRANRYSESAELNHTGYSALAGLDWSAADAFSGRLSFGTERAMVRFGGADSGFVAADGRVLQTSQEAVLRGQYGGASLLTIEAALGHRELDFTKESEAAFEQDAVSVGLKYRPSGALVLGVGLRHTDGSFPFTPIGTGGTQADDFKRDDIDLSGVWVATGASTLSVRLSYTRERHRAARAREVRGTTGALSWNFRPTGKLALTADLIRDTGAETSFAGGAPGAGAAVNSPLATTFQFSSEYEFTAKVKAQATVRYLKRDLADTAGTTTGDDSLTESRLGVNWAPLRSVLVGCSVGREERNASSGLSYSYSATTARCLAQFKTQ